MPYYLVVLRSPRDHREIRCYDCQKVLLPGTETITRGSCGNNKAKYRCPECARRHGISW